MGVAVASPNTDCFAKHCRKTLNAQDPVLLAMCEPSLRVVDELTKNIRELAHTGGACLAGYGDP